jgi:hypothetical protein
MTNNPVTLSLELRWSLDVGILKRWARSTQRPGRLLPPPSKPMRSQHQKCPIFILHEAFVFRLPLRRGLLFTALSAVTAFSTAPRF